MSTALPMPTLDPGPSVPPKVRTVAYFVGLAVGALVSLAVGLAVAVAPEAAPTVLAVGGALTTTTTFVVGGIAMFYRPTAGLASEPKPPKIDGNTWGDGTPVEGTPVVGDAPAAG